MRAGEVLFHFAGHQTVALFIGYDPDRNIGKNDERSRDHQPHLLAHPVAPPALPRPEKKQKSGNHGERENGVEHSPP
jgi:hypothetical protein